MARRRRPEPAEHDGRGGGGRGAGREGAARCAGRGPPGQRAAPDAGEQLRVEGVVVDLGAARASRAQTPVEVVVHVVCHCGSSFVVVGWCAARSRRRARAARMRNAAGRDAERLRGLGAGQVEPGGQHDGLAIQRRQGEQRGAQLAVLDELRGVGPGERGCRSSSACSAPARRRLRRPFASTRRVTPISQPSSALRGMSRWRRHAIAYVSATASSASSRDAIERAYASTRG